MNPSYYWPPCFAILHFHWLVCLKTRAEMCCFAHFKGTDQQFWTSLGGSCTLISVLVTFLSLLFVLHHSPSKWTVIPFPLSHTLTALYQTWCSQLQSIVPGNDCCLCPRIDASGQISSITGTTPTGKLPNQTSWVVLFTCTLTNPISTCNTPPVTSTVQSETCWFSPMFLFLGPVGLSSHFPCLRYSTSVSPHVEHWSNIFPCML